MRGVDRRVLEELEKAVVYRDPSIQCIYNTIDDTNGYRRRWRTWNEVEEGERESLRRLPQLTTHR